MQLCAERLGPARVTNEAVIVALAELGQVVRWNLDRLDFCTVTFGRRTV
jgi:hypothetical protein